MGRDFPLNRQPSCPLINNARLRFKFLQGSYTGSKKSGDGAYQFLNSDVYEGEFSADRMDGYGVYTFTHEGRCVSRGGSGG